jgi:hypothetical protein
VVVAYFRTLRYFSGEVRRCTISLKIVGVPALPRFEPGTSIFIARRCKYGFNLHD